MKEKKEIDIVSTIILGIASFALYTAYRSGLVGYLVHQLSFWGIIFLLLAVLSAVLVGITLISGYRAQRAKNKRAQSLVRIALSDRPYMESVAIYLRPFEKTGKFFKAGIMTESKSGNDQAGFHVIQYKPTRADLKRKAAAKTYVLEEFISEALNDLMEVVALGERDQIFGIGNVEVKEDRWTDVITSFIEHAELIIVVPAANNGTYWEMREIIRLQALRKTVFIMPSAEDDDLDSVKGFWQLSTAAMARLELEAPDYDSGGCYILYNDNKQIEVILRLDDCNNPERVKILRDAARMATQPYYRQEYIEKRAGRSE